MEKELTIIDEDLIGFLLEYLMIEIEKYHNGKNPTRKKQAYEDAKFYQQHINMEIEINKAP